MELTSALFDLANVFLACRDQDTLLKIFAARVGPMLGARAVLVWTPNPTDKELRCRARWMEPGERFNLATEASSDGLLAEIHQSLRESAATRRLGARDIFPNSLLHLEEAGRTHVKCALYASLQDTRVAQGAAGVVEVLNKVSGDFTAEDAHLLEEACRLASHTLNNLAALERERHDQLAALERLTALYDLGCTFTSTLELAELLPIVAEKIRGILTANICNLWLVEHGSEELCLAQRAGEDPTVEEGARTSLTEGPLGEIVQQAKPKLLENPGQMEEFRKRQGTGGEFEIQTWMAAPLRKGDEVLGAVELINKGDGSPFGEDDLFFLSSISEQAAASLHNARLLESERKVHALAALLKISKEITATLDLSHVLTTVVQQAASVVPFDQCAIGFYDRRRFVLGAISGETEVPKSSEMDALRERLECVAEQKNPVSVSLSGVDLAAQTDEARSQFIAFLEEQGYAALYALPLLDEQGALGALALLSRDAEFLTENNKETVAILASQTTVAIRNAQLYQQMPLVSVLQPLASRKQKLLRSLPRSRWREYLERAAACVLFLMLVPWPVRVGADATVVPAERRVVSSVRGGVVSRVFVHEGDAVQAGTLLAQLDDGEDRLELARHESALAQAKRDLAEAEFRNDPSLAGPANILVNLHAAEVDVVQKRVGLSQLRAPIAGIVVTPKVEEKTGTMLRSGELFCEVFGQDRMGAEMSVEEADLGLVQIGKGVGLKLNAYPGTTFLGAIDRIGERTKSEAGLQYFLARAVFENPGGRVRDGMVGRARIRAAGGWFHTGWYPIGYVLLRSPFRWAWEQAWAWLP